MMSGILYEQIINSKEMHLYDQIERTNSSGLILLGTIESDIHDIGKNIVKVFFLSINSLIKVFQILFM